LNGCNCWACYRLYVLLVYVANRWIASRAEHCSQCHHTACCFADVALGGRAAAVIWTANRVPYRGLMELASHAGWGGNDNTCTSTNTALWELLPWKCFHRMGLEYW
jgi:hypothetical protein